MPASTPHWASHLLPLTPTYALIDPMLGEPLSDIHISPGAAASSIQSHREAVWQRPVTLIKLHPSIELPIHQHPYLVTLEGLLDPLLGMTWHMAEDERIESQIDGLSGSGQAIHRMGGWVQSTLASFELSLRFSELMHVNTEAATQARYLRLGDRRVLAWLCVSLGEQRVSQTMGRINRWLYTNPFGRLEAVNSSHETPDPLHFSLGEWLDFINGHVLHQTIARWLGQNKCTELNTRVHGSRDAYLRAKAALDKANQMAQRWPGRFKTIKDTAIWAAIDLANPGIEIDLPSAAEPGETIEMLSPAILAALQEPSTS